MSDIPSVRGYAQEESIITTARPPTSESLLWQFGGAINWLLDRKSQDVVNYARSSGATFPLTNITSGTAVTDVSGTSVTYTTQGGLILILGIPDGTSNECEITGSLQVVRDGSLIARYNDNTFVSSILAIDPALAAGSYTWKLQKGGWAAGTVGTAADNMKLLVVELS